MVERPIPQDILKYKQKAIMNFSAREAIFGGIGIIVIMIGCFIWFKDVTDTTYRAIYSAIPAAPFFLVGFVKIYNVPIEKIIGPLIIDNFISPIKRKKEVHYPELEKREKTRYWLLNEYQEESNENKSRKKKNRPLNNKKPTCKKSTTLIGIK